MNIAAAWPKEFPPTHRHAEAFAVATDDVSVKPDTEYQHDPIGWIVDRLGIPEHTIRWSLNPGYQHHTWDGDKDPLALALEALAAGKHVAIESATGTGKTFIAAAAALWFSACFEDSLVVTIAPKEEQLIAFVWKEIGRMFGKYVQHFPNADKGELVLRHKPDAPDRDVWRIVGWACGIEAGVESSTKAQGFHAKDMLLITDETPGIPLPTMAALATTAVGDHNVQLSIGNPNSRDDALHKFGSRNDVVLVRISAYDHPNVVLNRDVVPGATTPKGIENIKQTWGHGTPMYDSRARGICPAQAAQALIKREWCERAIARYQDQSLRRGKGAKGVDAAQSQNGDEASIADWRGQCCLDVRAFPCPNATDLGTQVFEECERDDVEWWYVGVDPIGVGAATINELNKLTSFGVQALNFGARPFEATQRAPDEREYDWAPDANAHGNLRAQIYWQMREDLRLDAIAIPNDPELVEELTNIQWTPKRGKIYVEDKLEIRKRLGRSPNKADAVVMGNWVRRREKVQEIIPEIENINDPAILAAEYERNYRASRVRSQPVPSERLSIESDPMFGDF